LLRAMQRGVEVGDPEISAFLQTHFRPRYRELLLDTASHRCLDRIRSEFRNPAAHGPEPMFGPEGYETFCRLLTGSPRLTDWYNPGPSPPPPDPGRAILPHLLVLAGTSTTLESAVARLLDLRSPSETPLAVRLQVERSPDRHPSASATPTAELSFCIG